LCAFAPYAVTDTGLNPAGAALPLLLAYAASGRGLTDVLTAETVAQELVRTLVGSIGLVAAVPITTLLAALIAMQEHIAVPVRRKRKPPTQDDMPTEEIRLEDSARQPPVRKRPQPQRPQTPTETQRRQPPPGTRQPQRPADPRHPSAPPELRRFPVQQPGTAPED